MKTALVPGSFDPLTNGHLDVIERSARLFDRVIVAVARSEGKGTFFDADERLAMASEVVDSIPGVSAELFDGMLIHEFERLAADVVVRGVRLYQDFEYEYTMALMNRRLLPGFEVLFLMPSEEVLGISSTLVRDIHLHGGDLTGLIPESVQRRLDAAKRGAS